MAITLDGTLGITTPSETNTGTLSVTGVTTLTGGLNAALPVLSGGTGVTTKTGTGAVVLGTSPTLTTPVINGAATGTGVATAATVNTLVMRGTAGEITGATYITANATPMSAGSVGSNPGTAAIWDASGNLYKLSSSMRYKENITEWALTNAQLDAFVRLNPKMWDYIGKENGCFGFIAEDIEALGLKNAYGVSPLLNYSNEGKPDSNRDFSLIALQHKVIQRLEKSIQELKAIVDAQAVRIAALES